MRNLVKRTGSAASVAVVAVLLFATVAFAATYSLFGDAEIVSPGNASLKAVQLRSDNDPGWGGINFDVPAGTTFADLDLFSADFLVQSDDQCVGGSPRLVIRVDTGTGEGNIISYFGPDSGSAPCTPGTWQNTGDLLQAGKLVDATQVGGLFYQEYSTAEAAYGAYEVVSVFVVIDSSWAHTDGEQTVLVDNVQINNVTYNFDQPANANDCKNDGWKTLTRADGSTFKNQGDCIQYVNTGK